MKASDFLDDIQTGQPTAAAFLDEGGTPEGVSMRGPQADVPGYISGEGPLGALGNTLGKVLFIGEKEGRGLVAGLDKLGERGRQVASAITGDSEGYRTAARNIAGIEQGTKQLGLNGSIAAGVAEAAPAVIAGGSSIPGAMASSFVEGATSADSDGTRTLGDRAVQGAVSAALAGALGGASKIAGKGINAASSLRQQRPSADDIRKLANAAYDEADKAGGTLSTTITNKLVSAAENLQPQTEAGRLIAGENEVTKLAERLSGLRNKQLTLRAAQEVDEELGSLIDGLVDTNGRLSKEGQKVWQLQTAFRDSIEQAGASDIVGGQTGFEALKQGRGLWAQQARLRDIEKILTRAQYSPNPATAIKSGFRTLVSNPSRLRGYSPEAVALMKKAADSGFTGDALATFGSRLMGLVGLGTNGVGGAIGAHAAATASRGGASLMQTNRALKVADSITGFAPKAVVGASGVLPGLAAGMTTSAALDKVSRSPSIPQQQFTTVPKQRVVHQALPDLTTSQYKNPNEVSPTFIKKLIHVESGGRSDAKAKGSTALGAAQITKDTWLHLIDAYRPELMVGKSLKEILDMRKDQELSEELAGRYAEENMKILSKAGVPVTDTTVYLAHFLGPQNAVKLLTAKVGTPVTPSLVGKGAINANKSVLAGKKAEDVLRWAQRKMSAR